MSAGTDRGELLIIADESDAAAPPHDVIDNGVESKSVGHAGFVDDHQGVGPDRGYPVMLLAFGERPYELGQRLGASNGQLLAQFCSAGC